MFFCIRTNEIMKLTLEQILGNEDRRVFIGFIWLRIRTSGELL